MAWVRKLMRTVRVRNLQSMGVLARLLTAIADSGGSTGNIDLISETSRHVVRDITIHAEDEPALAKVLEAMRLNPGTVVIEVRDGVLELHQKGKIAIRSRYPVDSLTTLRAGLHTGRGRSLSHDCQRPDSGAPVHEHQPPGGHRHRWDCRARIG